MLLTIGRVSSPLGDLLLVSDAAGRLHASDFADCEGRLHRLLTRRLGPDHRLTPGAPPPAVAQALARYFAGEVTAIDAVPVVLGGSDFQNRAWAALREIPAGQRATYGQQARRIGNPAAARAVGSANHDNPCNIIVPCHRIVGADGALTGYAGGLPRKRWLLTHEDRHAGGAGRLL